MGETAAFVPFGTSHLSTMAAILLVSVGVPLWVRRSGSERLARRLAVAVGVVGAIHELLKSLAWVVVWKQPWAYALPLEICGVAVYLTVVVLIWRPFRVYEVVYFWGLAGALQAILTPGVFHDFPHPLFVTFFLSHGLILFGLFYATLVFRLRPTWSSVPRVFAVTLFYAFVIVAPINLLLDTNYMFLRAKPSAPSVLDFFGPWPWYIAGAAAFTLASFAVYYLPFWIQDLRARRSSDLSTRVL